MRRRTVRQIRLVMLIWGTWRDRHRAARLTTTREFTRDPLIVAIGKVRSGFSCEAPSCLHPTFMDAGNLPYCEVHHIRPLAEGGTDDLANVACLCPAHHREVHCGKVAAKIRVTLVRLRKQDGAGVLLATTGIPTAVPIVGGA
jgi:HNH endonuclease